MLEVHEQKGKPSLARMFWNPREQLLKIKQNPIIALPLLIVTIIFIIASTLKAVSIRPEDIMLPGMSIQEAEMVAANVKAFTAMSGFISPLLSITGVTILYFLILKAVGKEVTFRQIFSMNIFIFVIGAAGLIVNSLLWIVFDGSQSGWMFTSLGGLLKSEIVLLHSIELFRIWSFIVTSIGFQTVGRLSKSASVILAIILFILQASISFIGEGLFSLLN